MHLLSLRTVQWLTLVGSIAGVLSLVALWDSPYRSALVAATVALPIVTAAIELQKDRLTVFFTGIRKFYRLFPIEQNTHLFRNVTSEYIYFGVSFGSVLSIFRVWYGSPERLANIRIRLVLVDPDALDILEFQARYERNLWTAPLSDAERRMIDDTVKRVRDSISLVLDTIATLPPASPPIEIYFHREKVRKWIHKLNGDQLYVGLLPLGTDGLQAPVLELTNKDKNSHLFSYYQDELESILQGARRADLPSPR